MTRPVKWIQRFGRKQILKRENIYINCDETFHKNRFCGCMGTGAYNGAAGHFSESAVGVLFVACPKYTKQFVGV